MSRRPWTVLRVVGLGVLVVTCACGDQRAEPKRPAHHWKQRPKHERHPSKTHHWRDHHDSRRHAAPPARPAAKPERTRRDVTAEPADAADAADAGALDASVEVFTP